MEKDKLQRNTSLGFKASPYLFLAPAIIIMAVLVFYPILVTFTYSLQAMKLTEPEAAAFVGLSNYADILSSPEFYASLLNTLFVMVVTVCLCLLLGLGVSQILNVDTRAKGFLMAIAVLPWAFPPVVNGILWKFIFNSGYGLVNKLLLFFNLVDEPVAWLAQRGTLLFVVAFVVAWRNIPFCAVIFLSAMHTIPPRLYSAANLDGASHWQSFRHITLPLLLPAFAIALTNVSISSINVFDEIVILSGMGNLGKTLLVDNYLTTFAFLNFGMGSAFSYIVMLLSGALGLLYIRRLERRP